MSLEKHIVDLIRKIEEERRLGDKRAEQFYNAIVANDDLLAAHASRHELGGADQVDHDNLLNFVANEHIDWTNAANDFKTTGSVSSISLIALSPTEVDYLKFYHDDTTPHIRWNDGNLRFQTDKGINTVSTVTILGKGTGAGVLRVYDQDDAEYVQFSPWSGYGIINNGGTSPQGLKFQSNAVNHLIIYNNGQIAFPAFPTEELKLIDSGSVDATEQDWIEVTVGGNTGYIRVYAAK